MSKTKKRSPKPAPAGTVVQNCTFQTMPESDAATEKRAEAVKELAIALGKAADALRGAANNVTGLTIKGDV
jgi:hypothetical protein